MKTIFCIVRTQTIHCPNCGYAPHAVRTMASGEVTTTCRNCGKVTPYSGEHQPECEMKHE